MKLFTFVYIFSLFLAGVILATGSLADTPPVLRRVAVTIDDLPAQRGDLAAITGITNGLAGFLASQRIPAVGFVNAGKLNVEGEQESRAKLLRQWCVAGLELGNHTFSHFDANSVSLAAYEEDVIRGEQPLRDLWAEQSATLRYFRHPFLHMGAAAGYQDSLTADLKERGYTIAPVTIDNSDYMFGYAYDIARNRGDSTLMDSVVAAYGPYMDSVFAFYERLSVETVGYEVPQILLLHAHRLNAEHFSNITDVLRKRGYSFITLDEALKDGAYAQPVAATKKGCSWIQRWRMARDLPFEPEPDVPAFVEAMMNNRR